MVIIQNNLIFFFFLYNKHHILFFIFIVVDKSIDIKIAAHDTEIGALAVNPEGTLIASASERGHIIKIYSTDGGEVVQELKRGNSKADITSIIFHPV
jgi:autophagy-related protein 18